MIAYQSKCFLLKYDPNLKILFAVWLNIEELDDLKYKEALKIYTDTIYKLAPEKVLFDISQGYYPQNNELLLWNEEKVVTKVEKSNVKKVAFVLPKSLLLHSIVAEDYIKKLNKNSSVKREIFYSYNKALDWIME